MDGRGTASRRRPMGDLAPDPELWAALGHGERLTEILEEFYRRVYADERLSPFFAGITREWIVQKQYSFLRARITGEKTYFGNLPRKAHHWMVISDELFDHREAIMEACLREAGLPEPLVRRWLALEEVYRKQIVKAAPIPLKINGVPLPLEGYETIELEVGSLCDGCGRPVDAGTTVRCHVRTGTIDCTICQHAREEPAAGDARA